MPTPSIILSRPTRFALAAIIYCMIPATLYGILLAVYHLVSPTGLIAILIIIFAAAGCWHLFHNIARFILRKTLHLHLESAKTYLNKVDPNGVYSELLVHDATVANHTDLRRVYGDAYADAQIEASADKARAIRATLSQDELESILSGIKNARAIVARHEETRKD